MKLGWLAVWVALQVVCSGAWGEVTPSAAEQARLLQDLERLAQRGSAEAEYHLGMLYNNGIGVPADPARAWQSFTKAAALGDPLGAYKVGCYLAGQFPGVVPLDPDKAQEHKLVAAQAGYSLAQHDVGLAYLRKSMYAQAQPWLERAAAQGEPMSLFNLSVGHLRAHWEVSDPALGYAYFKLAKLVAEGSVNPRAQAALDDLARKMSPDQIARAEAYVVNWKAEPTALTRKAKQGLGASKALVMQTPP